MIHEVTTKMMQGVCPERMKANIEQLCQYERYQITPGYHDAAMHCMKILERDGFQPQLLTYSAAVGSCYNTDTPPLGWRCGEAWCELENEGGRRIADHYGTAGSVLERSAPCPEMKEPVELILMDKGADESAYESVDMAGKVLFLPADVNHYAVRWAFEKKGAIGFVCVHDLGPGCPHTLSWDGVGRSTEPTKVFGFAMPNEEGTNLYWSLRRKVRDGEKLMVRCCVDAEFYEGEIENVTALLPGELDEEVLIVAHLCHPKGSCNDNLSGVAAGMEALRTIKRRIERGDLPPLKRGVRLLLVPEILGSNAYMDTLTKEERKKIIAGINLDMVGATQNDHNGPLIINEPPHADPNFVTALCAAILEPLREDVRITGRYGYVQLFNSMIMEYRGGSDHVVYCDPNCGVPMPMLGQEPDKFYHTSDDSPECMDYFILGKSCALAAAYCYTIAHLTLDDMNEISFQITQRLLDRISMASRRSLAGEFSHEEYDRRMEQLNYFYGNMYDSFLRYFDGEELAQAKTIAAAGKAEVLHLVKTYGAKAYGAEPVFTGCRLKGGKFDKIPVRRYFGATQDLEPLAKLVPGGEEALEHYENNGRNSMWSHIEHQCEYYIDGKRTCGEIIDMTRRECYGKSTDDDLFEYIETLVKLQLADFIN